MNKGINFKVSDETGFIEHISNEEFSGYVKDTEYEICAKDIEALFENKNRSFIEELFVSQYKDSCVMNKNFQIMVFVGYKFYDELYAD